MRSTRISRSACAAGCTARPGSGWPAAGAPALQVAEHLARAAAPGDAEAIGWLTRAAREAAATSPDVAADLLERAIGLMDPADPGRDRLLAERASSLMWAGRIAAAEESADPCWTATMTRSAEGPARICLGHALLASGRPRDGLRELERAGSSPVLTDAERASALGWASVARRWLGDLDGAAATAEQARSAAAAAARPPDHRHRHGLAGRRVRTPRRPPGRAPDHRRGRCGWPTRALAGRDTAIRSTRTRGFILVELDRLEEARSALDTGRRISEELGVGWHLPSYQMVRTARALHRGGMG